MRNAQRNCRLRSRAGIPCSAAPGGARTAEKHDWAAGAGYALAANAATRSRLCTSSMSGRDNSHERFPMVDPRGFTVGLAFFWHRRIPVARRRDQFNPKTNGDHGTCSLKFEIYTLRSAKLLTLLRQVPQSRQDPVQQATRCSAADAAVLATLGVHVRRRASFTRLSNYTVERTRQPSRRRRSTHHRE